MKQSSNIDNLKFETQMALKNIIRKPFRAVAMGAIAMLLSFALLAGAFTIISLQRGLDSYRARLGADVIVVPNSSKGHGTVDDVLLQGITGNYYVSGKDCDKVENTPGVAAVSKQFYLASAKASCCSVRVQIIGFDPETDFSVLPWINEEYSGEVGDGDIVVGSKISMPVDRKIRFYGETYNVVAQLRETGTGLDNSVYANMNTVKQMADDASNLFSSEQFKGVDVENGASAIMIQVADGYEISDVADDINIHITKVQATPARSMVSNIADGLGNVSRIIGGMVAVIWVMAIVILAIAYALLSNERKKEFAVMRVMGASRRMLGRIMSRESAMISFAGSLLGLLAAWLVSFPISSVIKYNLELPYLQPGRGASAALSACALALSVLIGVVTTGISARRITGNETGLLLREDA